MESKPTLPILTKLNWNSEFKGAFTDMALRFGAAGKILSGDLKTVTVRPSFEMTKETGDRVYANDEFGWKMFHMDHERYSKIEEGKMKLISYLKEYMDREIKSKVEAHPQYSKAMSELDLLQLWQITEEVCVGRGSVSIYQLISRLAQIK